VKKTRLKCNVDLRNSPLCSSYNMINRVITINIQYTQAYINLIHYTSVRSVNIKHNNL